MPDVPFPYRIAALALVLAVSSSIDWAIRGPASVRWRYSILILGAGALAAMFGAAHDAVTVRISPEYFADLKGLGCHDLHRRACALGMKAGFSFGVIASMLLAVLAERRRGPTERPRPVEIARSLSSLPAAALTLAAVGAIAILLASRINGPLWHLPPLTQDQAERLLIAWTIHACTYTGAVVALILCCFKAPSSMG